MSKILWPHIVAPAFNLSCSATQKISLKDSLSHGNVILLFYPEDSSPACVNQMILFSEAYPLIQNRVTQVFGISTDSVASQQSFAAQHNIAFPLLSDSDPLAAVAKAYGVFSDTHQLAQQALFLIDGNGNIRWSYYVDPEINSGADGILHVVEALSEGPYTFLTLPPDAGDHALNGPAVNLIFLQYGDYQSPECAAARSAVKAMQTEFGDSLTYIYRHFPLTRIHPEAQAAAEVAEFAASQGKFWEMHELLFDNQTSLGAATYTKLATSLGLDPTALTAALAAKTFAPNVQADFEGGVRTGVNGTPCFYMGGPYVLTTRYNGKIDGQAMITSMNNVQYPDGQE